jgi:1-acyl-sn-glycerol-3-phosphate acyltransferase
MAGMHDARLARPSPAAPRLYRVLLAGCRVVARLLRFQLDLVGAEHLPVNTAGRPAGGWIAAGLPHRTWVDPFVLALLLPVEPRLTFLGEGRAIFRSRLRRFVFRRIGGVVPIWPGASPAAFERHVAAARSVVGAGAVFALFPEVGPPVPVDQARPVSPGICYFALRTGAPIVPLVLGGTHELYLGRRICLRVLPPVTARDLAGLRADEPLPDPGTAGERAAAARMARTLHEMCAPAVAEAHAAVEPAPGTRKRFRSLTRAFR